MGWVFGIVGYGVDVECEYLFNYWREVGEFYGVYYDLLFGFRGFFEV